jgi:Fe-S-cluster containining protein
MKTEMIEFPDNPCVACSIGQDCCSNLSGLRLLESEYSLHFARQSKRLRVKSQGQFYTVSSKDAGPCPHWIKDRCAIYYDRPIECRLFPYTIGLLDCDDSQVVLTIHARTHCPLKKKLLVPKVQAEELVRSFACQAFGTRHLVKIEHETLLSGVKHKVKKVMSKFSIQSFERRKNQ